MNVVGVQISIGPILKSLKSFTSRFPPSLIGHSIGNSLEVRIAHNTFALPDPFRLLEEDDVPKPPGHAKTADVFHFVSYVSVGGAVYELDGLEVGPVLLGNVDVGGGEGGGETWLGVARRRILDRIERARGGIQFNLIAVGVDRLENLKEFRANRNANANANASANASANAAGGGGGGDGVKSDSSSSSSSSSRSTLDLDVLDALISDEEAIRERWKEENRRRRHDYLPLIVGVLETLAKKGKLRKMLENADEGQRAKGKGKEKE